MESKIPKEKLKPGKLYKTMKTSGSPYQTPVYRVWNGFFWSAGTVFPKHKLWSAYSVLAPPSEQEDIIVVNKVATPFKQQAPSFQFKSAFVVPDKKPIRFLNRP